MESAKDQWVHVKNIGAGGFGVVKLFSNKSGAVIVLKELRLMMVTTEIHERWLREMEILLRLDHNNIVKALPLPDGLELMHPMTNTPYICMEYCDGGDLRQVLREDENCCGLTEVQIRQICQDVNSGIKFLHSQRVIHRDLKPENILIKKLNKNKVVYKLTDFGYAKTYDQSSVCTSLVGTMQYVAPEVLRDKRYNSSVDFWSFGMVMFECITGKRPFFHGDPPMALAWVDWVAKKGPDDIHIYWGQDEDVPVYSNKLPQPHRLSRCFEGQITSWLQTALKYNPEMRGGRFRGGASEDAPCLTNMEHILNTKVVNALCMCSGDMHSFDITEMQTIEDLQQAVYHCTGVPCTEQYLVLPGGYMPLLSDSSHICVEMTFAKLLMYIMKTSTVSKKHLMVLRKITSLYLYVVLMDRCLGLQSAIIDSKLRNVCFDKAIRETNPGTVYVFSTSFDPSFKMMHNTTPSVSNLIAQGEGSIPPNERREVYSQVLFFIQKQFTLFDRLHCGHAAILPHIRKQCEDISHCQHNLKETYQQLIVLGSYVQKVYLEDCERLSSFYNHQKVFAASVIRRPLESWRMCLEAIQQKMQEVDSMSQDIVRLREEAVTMSKLADDLQFNYNNNEQVFEDFYQKYVSKAQEIYHDCKVNKGHVTVGRMCDLLLEMMQTTDQIIREKLNGFNFGRVFYALSACVCQLHEKLNVLEDIKGWIVQTDDRRRSDLWLLLQHEQRRGPFSTVHSNGSSTESLPVYERQISKHSSASGGNGPEYTRQPSQQSIERPFSRRISEVSSVSSVDVSDPLIEESLQKFERLVSKEENDRVIEKNSQLLSRLQSLSTRGSQPEFENGDAADNII